MSFSSDGYYLAAGESAFNKPEITIWKVDYKNNGDPQDNKFIAEFAPIKFLKGHKFGIEALKFSPDS